MKTAISVPDDVFADAERLAKRLKKSRSELYSNALREFVARHADDRVTESLDDVIASAGEVRENFAPAAARRALKRVDW
jgi:metal-responsive CopG/Arc/MetJ family transcriptional regulator